MKKVLIIFISVFFLCACGNNVEEVKVINIDSQRAQEIMKEDNYIIIDVRTEEEYNIEHIKGSTNIPVDRIDDILNKVAPQVEVIVYCQSGNRSKQAALKLIDLGYTKVYDLGGINSVTLEKETGDDSHEEIS